MTANIRRYLISDVVSFAKTTTCFGGLSNMAPKYSLFVNEVSIPSSECLYQACKFPLYPHIQKEIIEQSSPMTAKEISRKYNQYVRSDWDEIKFKVMEWCLAAKLVQNWSTFSELLVATGNKPIVEYSTKDTIWGAKKDGDYLVGTNALGRLLMQVRSDYIINAKRHDRLLPPDIVGFMLYGYPIGIIYSQDYYVEKSL